METFPDIDPDEIRQKHFTISLISKHPQITTLLTEIGVPSTVLDQLRLLTIPSEIMTRMIDEYEIVRKQADGALQFSLDDFIIAYIAAMYRWCVISYDMDLLSRIHHYLVFEALLPSETSDLPSDSLLLLDTNVLLEFTRSKGENKEDVISMITKNPHLTFLISANILEEMQRVLDKLEWTIADDIAIHLDPAEKELVKFIDNFEGFQSPHKTRKKRKLREYHKKKKRKDRLHGKWGNYLD